MASGAECKAGAEPSDFCAYTPEQKLKAYAAWVHATTPQRKREAWFRYVDARDGLYPGTSRETYSQIKQETK